MYVFHSSGYHSTYNAHIIILFVCSDLSLSLAKQVKRNAVNINKIAVDSTNTPTKKKYGMYFPSPTFSNRCKSYHVALVRLPRNRVQSSVQFTNQVQSENTIAKTTTSNNAKKDSVNRFNKNSNVTVDAVTSAACNGTLFSTDVDSEYWSRTNATAQTNADKQVSTDIFSHLLNGSVRSRPWSDDSSNKDEWYSKWRFSNVRYLM